MSSKIRSQRFKGHFNEVDDWSLIIAKRIVWCPIIAIFSSPSGATALARETAVCNWFHILCPTYIHMAKHFSNKLMNCTDLSNYPDLLVPFSLWCVNSLVFK